jgi:hypothetical protein
VGGGVDLLRRHEVVDAGKSLHPNVSEQLRQDARLQGLLRMREVAVGVVDREAAGGQKLAIEARLESAKRSIAPTSSSIE